MREIPSLDAATLSSMGIEVPTRHPPQQPTTLSLTTSPVITYHLKISTYKITFSTNNVKLTFFYFSSFLRIRMYRRSCWRIGTRCCRWRMWSILLSWTTKSHVRCPICRRPQGEGYPNKHRKRCCFFDQPKWRDRPDRKVKKVARRRRSITPTPLLHLPTLVPLIEKSNPGVRKRCPLATYRVWTG